MPLQGSARDEQAAIVACRASTSQCTTDRGREWWSYAMEAVRRPCRRLGPCCRRRCAAAVRGLGSLSAQGLLWRSTQCGQR